MNSIVKYFTILLIFLPIACKNKDTSISLIQEEDLDLQMIAAYKEGMQELEDGNVILAAKKFNEAELLYPQSLWAPRSSLMAAYAYYLQLYYADAIRELERFLKTYPNHIRKDYAHYLLGMSYYDQIISEKKDLGPIEEAKKNFEFVIKNYPNTDFALDSKFKLDLINDVLASKEIYLGRYWL